jgi:pyruvate dehydrogenase E2 component (dihydrolipoamide acetyltransferase)
MPRLSDSMEEGTIVAWLVADGQGVERGQEIVEIETDKATMPFEAPEAGRVWLLAAAGASVPVGGLIAVIGEAPEPGVPAATGDPAPAGDPTPTTAANASPVAKRIAVEHGVDLATVRGTGPGGRVTKRDVLDAAAAPSAPAVAPSAIAEAGTETGTAKGAVERTPLTRTQQVVARRMAEARATVPDFSVSIEVDAAAAAALRDDLSPELETAPTLNDLIVVAVGRLLRRHPRLNSSYRGDAIEVYERVNVGVAVAVEDDLVVPTVFDADAKSLADVAVETRRLVDRARTRALTPPDVAGGTFTVSNLGMFGVTEFVPIVNPPQAAILAVGAARTDGAGRRPMTLTLVCDHRVVYGAHAAAFLRDLRELFEHPLRILAQ